MAEIQIGCLTSVPDHSPITSPWAKDVTRLGVHRFDTVAALNAASTVGNWPGLEDGTVAVVTAVAANCTGQIYYRRAGVWELSWQAGRRTVSFTAGICTTTHELGRLPRMVNVGIGEIWSGFLSVDPANYTTTNMRLIAQDPTPANYTGSLTIQWWCT